MSYVAFAVIAYAPIIVICIFKRYRYMSLLMENLILSIYWAVFFLGICLIRIDSISNSRYIYGLLVLFFWFPYFVYQKNDSEYTTIGEYSDEGATVPDMELWIIYGISLVSQLVWAVSTNQDIDVAGYMAFYAVLALVIYWAKYRNAMQFLIDFLILVAAFFAIIWIPEGNGGFAQVFERRVIVAQGPLQGVCVQEDYYHLDEAMYYLTNTYVGEDDYLLVTFGSNSSGYLNSNGKIAAHTVFDRTHKNTKVLTFWQQHPDHGAKYVIINEADKKYEAFIEGEMGQYLSAQYPNEVDRVGDVAIYSK